MNKFILTFVLLICSLYSFGQSLDWSTPYKDGYLHVRYEEYKKNKTELRFDIFAGNLSTKVFKVFDDDNVVIFKNNIGEIEGIIVYKENTKLLLIIKDNESWIVQY